MYLTFDAVVNHVGATQVNRFAVGELLEHTPSPYVSPWVVPLPTELNICTEYTAQSWKTSGTDLGSSAFLTVLQLWRRRSETWTSPWNCQGEKPEARDQRPMSFNLTVQGSPLVFVLKSSRESCWEKQQKSLKLKAWFWDFRDAMEHQTSVQRDLNESSPVCFNGV